MHKPTRSFALALMASGASLLSTAPVFAAEAPSAADAKSTTVGEVVVTARRRTENVQNVPVSVQAVSGESIRKLQLTQFQDIARVAPGLTLGQASGAHGSNAQIILRGVKWTSASGAPSTPVYLNEVPVDPNVITETMYDIDQIEVVRGPQGTARGQPSIAGAITLTSRTPNLTEFGGYGSALAGTHGHVNFQAAANVPIITDKLAVRVAGSYEDSEGSGVHSLFSPTKPEMKTESFRVAARYQPIEALRFNFTFQHLDNLFNQYDQVAGPGSSGGGTGHTAANYNGPAIATGDYLAVEGAMPTIRQSSNLFLWNGQWDVLGQTASYIGSYQLAKFGGINSADTGHSLINYFENAPINSRSETQTHEFRLESKPGDHPVDYVVGVYYNKGTGLTFIPRTSFTDFALGFAPPGGVPNPVVANPAAAMRYTVGGNINIPSRQETLSEYGTLYIHLPWATELTGGVRFIHDKTLQDTALTVGPIVAAAVPATAGVCPAFAPTPSPIYAGFCDVTRPASTTHYLYSKTYTPTIYNISLSHKFTPEIMGYFTTGTSYRRGVGNIGFNVISPAGDQYRVTKPEYATSYEVGLKTSWLSGHLTLNGDLFQIDYDGQLVQFPGINYFTAANALSQTSAAFYYGVQSRVRGVEFEANYRPMRDVSLGANLSYAQVESQGGSGPCNAAAPTATDPVRLCPLTSGQVLNAAPPFSSTVSGEYTLPFERFSGYVRGLWSFNGHNPEFGYLVQEKAYSTVDLFAGVKAADGAWDFGLYAKNLFDDHTETSRAPISGNLAPGNGTVFSYFGTPGYFLVTSVPRREVGVTLRYAFGSR